MPFPALRNEWSTPCIPANGPAPDVESVPDNGKFRDLTASRIFPEPKSAHTERRRSNETRREDGRLYSQYTDSYGHTS